MKKKVISCMLVVSMLAVSLVGCGSQPDESPSGSAGSEVNQPVQSAGGEEGETPSGEASKYQTTYGSKTFDNVTITVELFDRSNAPDGSTITDNKWTEYVNQEMNKVGINVEFVPVPRWDEVTKMQSMVAGKTAPDLTLTYTYAYAEDYFNQGGIWDLSEFVDGADQALNMKEYLGQEVLDIGRNAEGKLYGIVAKRATTAKSNTFIRKDWLDELGLSVPTTPDELYNVVEQMTKSNPDNRSDILGMIIWNAWNLRMAFSKIAGDPTAVEIASTEDAIQDYYDEGMRDYYRFMNKMYNNGPPESGVLYHVRG